MGEMRGNLTWQSGTSRVSGRHYATNSRSTCSAGNGASPDYTDTKRCLRLLRLALQVSILM